MSSARCRPSCRRLAALGVPRTDIRTESISSFRTRRHGRTVYRASTSLRIRTTDLARLPAILRALGGADLDGPEFSISDSTVARQEATRLALERARRRADAAATALGLRVTAIRKVDLNPEWAIDTGGSDDSASSGGGSRGSGSSAPIRVEPGQEQVTVAVAVIFALAPSPVRGPVAVDRAHRGVGDASGRRAHRLVTCVDRA